MFEFALNEFLLSLQILHCVCLFSLKALTAFMNIIDFKKVKILKKTLSLFSRTLIYQKDLHIIFEEGYAS